ncbi:NAD(P)-dependent oxidoreductase [Coraliomargarita akajimensis]|uniref:6-phosphogluconate dehydrogenase NAD-binding protein n=1 Tax=Coraliomargarita akajimensis (strain DSM 45221 / IAM 15411 / JCM 23193 / KCTC 12865 / 04OKA010-24) TaxID=583355 RepID=D5EI24_CORAD|nr:NAD(P)-dependent oxidoreductase [Coraliomargarita akajimensis]ADE56064.1 6-phosphogluconate dehydrogenase NAD-binding protein [Coraliomargarita akajimensis DSM 45221]
MQASTVAVLGLGIIGSIWAKHYQAAGLLSATWNRSPKPELSLPHSTLEHCAQTANFLQICVYDAESVRSVLEQLLPFLGESHTIIQSSTIDGVSSREFAKLVESRGAHYLEAPFTGSKPAAEERKTVFFLGGTDDVVESAKPLLELISAKRYHIGRNEQATAIKLAMNLQIAGISQALCEAITLSRQAGITDDCFFEVMKANVSWSGLSEMKEQKLRDADFSPQFSIKNLHKDMRLAQQTAKKPMPLLDKVVEALATTETAGYGDEDFIALIRSLH